MTTKTALLVADDDEGIRSSVSEILSRAGYEVRQAADGVEALASLAESPVDVMLLDMRMPNLDGIGVLEALAEPPVTILISAYAMDEVMSPAVQPKVFRALRKPVSPVMLLTVVADAVAHSGGQKATTVS